MKDKILAIIPARGGSKGILRKNVKIFAGHPLIFHTIKSAKEAKSPLDIVVSTDDHEIEKIAQDNGVEVIFRPKELAEDKSLVIDAIKYTVQTLKDVGRNYSEVVLLEPTSPLRKSGLIDDCLDRLLRGPEDCVATFHQCHISPNRLWSISNDLVKTYIENAIPWLPRQSQPVAYELNGLVYCFKTANLELSNLTFLTSNLAAIITKRDESIDIDTDIDFIVAETIMNMRKQ